MHVYDVFIVKIDVKKLIGEQRRVGTPILDIQALLL